MTTRKLAACIIGFTVSFLVVAISFALQMEPASAQTNADVDQQDQQFAVRGADTCLTCHNDPVVTSVLDTPHGNSAIVGSPAAQQDCESCHGASPTHVRGLQSPAVVYSDSERYEVSDADVQNQTCLNCHQSTETVHWAASIHQAADLTCVSCHNIHADQAAAVSQLRDADTCLTCHLEKRSELNRRSHHPVREGLMSCSDCHNPHGSDAVAMLAKSTINDTCATCHAEKRGPFLWEHQPVSEECTTCHNPHGSTQASMLTVRQPFLCQSCHSEAYHPSFLYSGDDIPPAGAGQAVLGTSCTNCHSSIHGSNHPSGSRLTR